MRFLAEWNTASRHPYSAKKANEQPRQGDYKQISLTASPGSQGDLVAGRTPGRNNPMTG